MNVRRYYVVYTRTNPDTPMATRKPIRSYNAKSGFHYAFYDGEVESRVTCLLAVVPIDNVDRIIVREDEFES